MTLLSDRFYLAVTVVVLTLVITALYRWTAVRAAHQSHRGIRRRVRSSAASRPTASLS